MSSGDYSTNNEFMENEFMEIAIQQAEINLRDGCGGPFGAVVVLDNHIIGRGRNLVAAYNDPTLHAEMVAIRDACQAISSFHLERASLFTTCEPCVMCLGAIYWARIEEVYFGSDSRMAQSIGFDLDEEIYKQVRLPMDQRYVAFQRVLAADCDDMMRRYSGKLY